MEKIGDGRDSRDSRDSRGPSAPSGGTYSQRPSGTDSVTRAPLSWAEREEVCDQIAAWILRALRGEHRGASGRDLIPYSSRIWIVARDFEGLVYQPVRIFRSFSAAKALAKRGADCGDSIFIGVPSDREARRIVAAARLGWPAEEN